MNLEVSKIKKSLSIILILIFIIININEIYASNLDIYISKMSGNNTYELQGEFPVLGDWESKLVFPLDTNVINLLYENSFSISDKMVKSHISYSSNIGDKYVGETENYDWFYFIKEEPAIYGIASSYINLDIYKLSLSIPVGQSNKYSFVLAYLQENYYYNLYNLTQTGVFGGSYYIADEVEVVDGEVHRYDLTYSIPYLGFAFNEELYEDVNIDIKLMYSPVVKATDFDNHLLRDRVAYGNTEGNMTGISLKTGYNIDSNSSIYFSYRYRNIYTEGLQRQEDYEGNILLEDIPAKIYSKQSMISLAYTYKF